MGKLAKRAARLVPSDWEAVFGDPPLIRGEKREDYEKLFSLVVADINPKDSLVSLLAREFTNLSWEIRRERRLKTLVIKFQESISIAKLLSPARPAVLGINQPPPTMNKIMALWSADAEALQKTDDQLAKDGFDASFVTMKALQEVELQVEAIDRRIENFERRRMAVLQSISEYSEASAGRLAASTEIIEGEYSEAAVRYREIFFGMLNLALSMVLYSVLGKFYEITGGTDGLRLERPPIAGMHFERAGYETALLVTALAASLVLGTLVQRYFGSAAGEALAGIKTNETRLEYLGLSARRILWNGYILSAGLCGLSGSLFVLLQGLVTPELGYWVRSGEFVFIAILGGSAHALGAFIGAVVFQIIQLAGTVFLSGAWKLLLGGTLIAVILVAPNGITGALPLNRWNKARAKRLSLQPAAGKH